MQGFSQRFILIFTALSGMAVVVLGAMGQHMIGLNAVSPEGILFAKAQKYHMWHTLALLFVASDIGRFDMTTQTTRWLTRAVSFCFMAGILLFCGNIYLKAFATSWNLDALVPIGGTLFILGWLLMAVLFAIMKKQ